MTPPHEEVHFRLPGTSIEAEITAGSSSFAEKLLDSFFAAGGLVLSQVSSLTGMEAYSVQNWIKRGFCSPPVNKKYSKSQFCRLVILHMLKDTLTLPEISGLLSYINGDLTDEGDDTLSDDRLYLYFLRTILLTEEYTKEKATSAAAAAIEDFCEPFPGGKMRLQRTLVTMVCAYHASLLHQEASAMLKEAAKDP